MPQTLEQIMATRKPLYDSQRNLIADQQAQLPGQEQADVQGLDTAKTNAFGDITNTANSRGVLYSGAPIQEQSRYVGEKYLPALAGVKNNYAGQRSKLEAALLGINQDETTSAQNIQNEQQKNEYQYATDQQKLALQRQSGLDMASLLGGGATQAAPAPVAAAPTFAKGTNPAVALQQLFNGYQPGGTHAYYTENVVVPALERIFSLNNPGMDPATVRTQAENKAYAYRRKVFGE